LDRSKRATGIQLPVGFVRTQDLSIAPPLSRMLRGGRGGTVRLKLYLCLYLLAAHPPYNIVSIPSRAWAEALALPDPAGGGARRIADALVWLQKAKMIKLERRQGAAPTVTLLDPVGDGTRFARPRSLYVRLPLGFWSEQWITRLSGAAVALLIVLLDLQGGKKRRAAPQSLAPGQRLRYGLSDDTWTRASKELVDAGLLTVKRVPQGRDFDWRRMRNAYLIDIDMLDKQAPS
jgi:hypothetical protein